MDPDYNDLRRRFSPAGSQLRLLQDRMLKMLVQVDEFCSAHGIRYWLSSGTCLGAIRHGGFIPWDDDVDIEMRKEDYERFVKLFHNFNGLEIQTPDNDPLYSSPYAKIRDKYSIVSEADGSDVNYSFRGAFIDVFCIEDISDFSAHLSLHLRWRLSMYGKRVSMTKMQRIVFLLRKKFIYKVVIPCLRLLDTFLPRRLQYTYGTGFISEHRAAEDVSSIIRVPFETVMLPVPRGYHGYLQKLYGNYLQLPDLDSIKPHFCEVTFIDEK